MKALIADGHWISRAGLSQLFALLNGKFSVTEATSFTEAAAALAKAHFDICLVDPDLPDDGPLDGLRKLRKAAPALPIAVITNHESRRFALQTVELGVQAFILKSASADEIRRAIKRVLAGEISLPDNLRDLPHDHGHGHGLSEAAAPYFAAQGDNPIAALTPRQYEVLGHIATGKRNAEIGKALEISPRTVQIHVSTILKLLGVSNRTEAALLARRHGIGA